MNNLLIIFAIIVLIIMFQTKLTRPTFFINMYLYIIITLLLIFILNPFLKNIKISPLVYLVIGFIAIYFINSESIIISNLCMLIFILIISASVNSLDNNIIYYVLGIFLIMTIITFLFPIKDFSRLSNYIIIILGILIIMSIIYPKSQNIKILLVLMFIFLIYYDTSISINKSNYLKNKTHYDINYPKYILGNILNITNLVQIINN